MTNQIQNSPWGKHINIMFAHFKNYLQCTPPKKNSNKYNHNRSGHWFTRGCYGWQYQNNRSGWTCVLTTGHHRSTIRNCCCITFKEHGNFKTQDTYLRHFSNEWCKFYSISTTSSSSFLTMFVPPQRTSDCCLTPNEQYFQLYHVTLRWNNDVNFVLDQNS